MASAIPDGFHSVTPFLNLQGAAAAIQFYQRAFGAEVLMRIDMADGAVGHAVLAIGDSRLFIEESVRNPRTASSFLIYVDDVDSLWKRATEAGAEVLVPLADQFWGDRWGALGDRWGNRWGIATHLEDVPEEELRRRALQARGG